MEAANIFKENQMLTLRLARELYGKRIICTSSEDRHNIPHVLEFIVGSITTLWDHAATQPCDGYLNRQAYWKAIFTKSQVLKSKNTYVLLDHNGKCMYTAHDPKESGLYNEPTFTGSDIDREVYYVEA
ncbi:MAG: hypothetical protein WCR36_03445 [Bacteroidaceae bacterium]